MYFSNIYIYNSWHTYNIYDKYVYMIYIYMIYIVHMCICIYIEYIKCNAYLGIEY